MQKIGVLCKRGSGGSGRRRQSHKRCSGRKGLSDGDRQVYWRRPLADGQEGIRQCVVILMEEGGKLCDDASRLVHRMVSMDRDVTPGQERDSACVVKRAVTPQRVRRHGENGCTWLLSTAKLQSGTPDPEQAARPRLRLRTHRRPGPVRDLASQGSPGARGSNPAPVSNCQRYCLRPP